MYWVHVSGVNGCANADTINVNQLPLPDFTLGKDTALCEQQQLTYSFNLPGAAYTWNTGSSSAQQIISQPGTYWLEVNQQGCKKRDSIDVLYKPLPQVNLGNDTTLCEGALYTLDPHSTGNPAYIWQDKSTNAVFNVHQQGTYWVAATLNGCTTADTIKIVYTLKPVFDLGGDTTICTGQLLTLHPNVNGAASYTWQDGSTGATFTVSEPGVYQVTATNNCGSTTGKITVTHGLCLLVMPNAFTPNRDGVNDVFRIKYPWFVQEFHMIIFNRWGEKVFETYDASQGWNGTYKGTVQPVDTYVWTISLTDKEGNKESSRGTVTLIR
jgi:gliding motility-associated-like protein